MQNAGVGSLSVLQGIFPTQSSDPGIRPRTPWVALGAEIPRPLGCAPWRPPRWGRWVCSPGLVFGRARRGPGLGGQAWSWRGWAPCRAGLVGIWWLRSVPSGQVVNSARHVLRGNRASGALVQLQGLDRIRTRGPVTLRSVPPAASSAAPIFPCSLPAGTGSP